MTKAVSSRTHARENGDEKMTAKQIKESLTAQLEIKGANVSHFVSLIEDYIFYWTQEKKMQADIKKNGLKYTRKSAQGVDIEAENPAVKSAYQYNKQKLQLLREMGLTTDNCYVKQKTTKDDTDSDYEL